MKMKFHSTSPLIVVSNRLPFILHKDPDTGEYKRKQCAGGLVTAVAPVVVETGGLWVGWPGIQLEENVTIPESDPSDKSPTAGLKSEQVIPVGIDAKVFDDYYNGCCNACFWPLFHSMPDKAVFQADKWEAYKTVNEEFAKLTLEAVKRIKEKDPEAVPLVWLHDYHLMIAANHVRELCDLEDFEIKMAFFLHIPFPSWDIMRLFPWDDELLQGILGCDAVGFHVDDYCLNFIDCCKRRLGCRLDIQQMLVEHNNRTVSIKPLPISIPFERFEKLALKAPTAVKSHEDEQIILGIDRLDYTKGLVNRVKALETLLQKHPEHIGKVSLLQVAVPSRTDVKEYQELKEGLDQLVGRVNGAFSNANWSPIRYIYGCVPQDQLAALYRDASIALVTPLRDGMNLVAKEFVACQTAEPGVLLLSPFAGAGATMHEALLVNPYETNEFAEVIHRALTMSKDERELRMKNLRRREKERDVNFWLKSFLKSVDCLKDDVKFQRNKLNPLVEEDFDYFLGGSVDDYTHVALLLDYDGTLAPIAPHPDLAIIPEEAKRVLERLSNMADVNVAIISGRSLENVSKMVGIPNLTYAGNHGFEILHPSGTKFVHPVPEGYQLQLASLVEKLKSEASEDGAWVEEKGPVMTYHYRAVPKDKLDALLKKAQQAFKEHHIKIHHSHMAYEARPPVTWDKGRAAIHILRMLFGVEFSERICTIFAGDDKTDEDAMRALQGMAITFRVTSQNVKTSATYRLPNTDAVLTMLKWLERRLSCRLPAGNGFDRKNSGTPRPRTGSLTAGSPRNSPCRVDSPMGSPSGSRKHTMVTNFLCNEPDLGRKNSPPRSPPHLPRSHSLNINLG